MAPEPLAPATSPTGPRVGRVPYWLVVIAVGLVALAGYVVASRAVSPLIEMLFEGEKRSTRKALEREPILDGVAGWREVSRRSSSDFGSRVRAVSVWDAPVDVERARRQFEARYLGRYPTLRWSPHPGSGVGEYHGLTDDRRSSLSARFLPATSPTGVTGASVLIEVTRG